MRLSTDILRRFVRIPDSISSLRELLDDVGVEVKRTVPNAPCETFVVELLANRGDHYCYEGVARELFGRLGSNLTLTQTSALTVGNSPWPLELQSDGCAQYSITRLKKTGDNELSEEALAVLEGAGIHSITPAIDATNITNLELGQPTHVFDAAKIDGPITIRDSVEGEVAWPLFEEEPRPLKAGTLVIADRSKILAVAGVIGCEESKATASTTDLLIESATFDPVRVRKASRAMGIHTDSSARFERGADPHRMLRGAGRVVNLLESTGDWRRVSDTGVVGNYLENTQIKADLHQINSLLGTSLNKDEILSRLQRYGFSVDGSFEEATVSVPSWRRWDATTTACLAEEVLKSVGYNNTPTELPPIRLGAVESLQEERQRVISEYLVHQGFYEVITDGFYGRDLVQNLGFLPPHTLAAHIQTQNALDRGYSLLKNNALAQAVSAVSQNVNRRVFTMRFFEFTRVFTPQQQPGTPLEASPCRERELLWGIFTGTDPVPNWTKSTRTADIHTAIGLVHQIAAQNKIELSISVDHQHELHDALHPGRQACIVQNGVVVGVVGEVHPSVRNAFKLKKVRPIYFEINTEALIAQGQAPAFEEPSDLQPLVRSLAFALPRGIYAQQVEQTMVQALDETLQSIAVRDHFQLEEKRAVTWELVFSNVSGDRSSEDVNAALLKITEAVRATWGERGVVQR